MNDFLQALHRTIVAGGIVIDGVDANGTVTPASLQAQAQPIIDAFVAGWPKAQRRAAVNAVWSRRKDAGFTWRGKRIDSDPASRENITNIAAAAMSLLIGGASPTAVIRPAGWKCADNTYTDPVTLADALNMHGTMITVGAAMFDRAQALKAAIDAAADPEAVDISVGWPE